MIFNLINKETANIFCKNTFEYKDKIFKLLEKEEASSNLAILEWLLNILETELKRKQEKNIVNRIIVYLERYIDAEVVKETIESILSSEEELKFARLGLYSFLILGLSNDNQALVDWSVNLINSKRALLEENSQITSILSKYNILDYLEKILSSNEDIFICTNTLESLRRLTFKNDEIGFNSLNVFLKFKDRLANYVYSEDYNKYYYQYYEDIFCENLTTDFILKISKSNIFKLLDIKPLKLLVHEFKKLNLKISNDSEFKSANLEVISLIENSIPIQEKWRVRAENGTGTEKESNNDKIYLKDGLKIEISEYDEAIYRVTVDFKPVTYDNEVELILNFNSKIKILAPIDNTLIESNINAKEDTEITLKLKNPEEENKFYFQFYIDKNESVKGHRII